MLRLAAALLSVASLPLLARADEAVPTATVVPAPSPTITPTPIPEPPPLPGKGLAQHPFLYCGEWDTRRPGETMYVVRDGKIVWSYTISDKEEYGDCHMLSNGNIVFSRKTGASEVTPDKKIVWNYDAPPGTEVHATQPLGLDRVMIVQNGLPAKLMIIQKASGKVEKEITLATKNPEDPKSVHGQFRRARVTKAGTLLVGHLNMGEVVEYDMDGKKLWSAPAPSVWSVVRLKNGNTLLGGNQNGYVREVNPKGEVVWELNKDDLPGYPLYVVQEVSRLANGNTVIGNWSGFIRDKSQWANVVQILEVTPEKKVVWGLREWKEPNDLGPASAIQLLDEPGNAEDGDLQR
jgi:hypothetical protein